MGFVIMGRNLSNIWVFLGVFLGAACWSTIHAAEGGAIVRRAIQNGPTFSRILDQTIDEDTSSIPSLFAVASSSSVTISRNSSNTDLVPNANIFISFTDPLWQVFVTPATNQFGTATITLTAEDANSVSGTTEFRVTVNPVADPVTVRLISPSQNQVFLAPATVELIAEAADPDGRIVSIDFFQGSKLIERVLSQPYTSKWTDVTPDDYSLTAVATDDAGNLVASEPVVVSVRSQLVGPRRQVDVVEGDLNSSRSVQIPILGLPLQAETITYWTSDGPGPGLDQNAAAIEGRDYLPIRPTQLTLDADTLTTTLTIVTLGEVLDERNELFFVNWSSPNPGFLVSTQLVVNIIDDDPSPFVSIDDVQVREGGGEAIFTLTLSTPSARDVFVEYTTEGGSAIEGTDYVSAPILATIRRAFSSTQITVPILNDAFDEPNETFFVNLGRTENVGIAKGRGQATILDDDEPPNISVREATPAHDHEDPTQNTDAVFAVELSSQSGFPISVDYATVDDTALAGFDYEKASDTLVFNPGETRREVVVPTLDDMLSEAPEIFFLRLSNPTNVTLTTPPSENRAIIFDSDPLPSLSISPASVLERDSESTNAVFEVTLSPASGQIVSVGFATSDRTATAGPDYSAESGTLDFQPNQVSKTISVPVFGDTIIETANELFFVNLFAPENAIIAVDQTFGIIVDNEPLTTVSIGDASVIESDDGFVNAVFPVRLADPISRTVTVTFSTIDETAKVNADYVLNSGTLEFLPQDTEKELFVQVLGDRLNEANELFKVVLSNPVEVLIDDGEGIGTIEDDDPVPFASIENRSDFEGNTDGSEASFQVNLSSPSGQIVTIDYAPSSGTAEAGTDFLDPPGSVAIPSGDTSATFSIPLVSDTIDEEDEVFFLNLSARNATLTVEQVQFTIFDDDEPPRLVVPEKSLPEGNSGITAATFDVQLSSPSGKTVSLVYSTTDGTALASEDYRALETETLMFEPGATNRTINVEIVGDELREADEVFFLDFKPVVNAVAPQIPIQITIADDDTLAGISVSDISIPEGNSGIAEAVFTVALSAPVEEAVSFSFATVQETAAMVDDFFPTTGSRIIKAGESATTIIVSINSDRLHESDESFLLKLSRPSNAVLLNTQARGIILDDDPEPVISVSATALLEGNTAAVNAVVTVSLSNASGQLVTVDYGTDEGTATAGLDYFPANGAIQFSPGDVEKSFLVQVFGDSLNEAKETVNMLLSNPRNASLSLTQGQTLLTILNDDPFPEISIADAQATEGGPEGVSMTFTVSLTASSGQEVSVSYFTSIGTATPGNDYLTCAS